MPIKKKKVVKEKDEVDEEVVEDTTREYQPQEIRTVSTTGTTVEYQ